MVCVHALLAPSLSCLLVGVCARLGERPFSLGWWFGLALQATVASDVYPDMCGAGWNEKELCKLRMVRCHGGVLVGWKQMHQQMGQNRGKKTRLFCTYHTQNRLGTVNPRQTRVALSCESCMRSRMGGLRACGTSTQSKGAAGYRSCTQKPKGV